MAPIVDLRGTLGGGKLPPEAWARRHRAILALSYVQAVALVAFGLWRGAPPLHVFAEGLTLVLLAVAAGYGRLGTRTRSAIASVGLTSSSAVLVHLSGGYIEAHFHFFVMLGVISLYEDWPPYLLAVAYVALHHGVVGTLDPRSVYNHPAAFADPWLWAAIHATFVLGLSAVNVVTWRVNEAMRARAEATQREAHRRIERTEKMAAMGSLVSGVAHEIRTPLTYIQTNLFLLERKLPPGDAAARAQIDAALEGVDRVNRIVGTLRQYTRLDTSGRAIGDLAPAVREAVELFRATHREANVAVKIARTPAVSFYPQQVHQIVLNLLENAFDAAPGGRLEIEAGPSVEEGALLVVRDPGPGIPAHIQPLLFQPLVTTKAHGTGLGLSIVKRIVDEHRAVIDVRTGEGIGTTFTIRFPAAHARPPSTEAVAPAQVAAEMPAT